MNNLDLATDDKKAEKERAKAHYDRVVETAELSDIMLINLRFDLTPKFFEVMLNDDRKKEPDSKFESKFLNASFDAEVGMLFGQIIWSSKMTFYRAKLFSLDATYNIAYSDVAGEVDERHAIAFLRRVGRFATYPYYRALVSRLSAESGMNLPPLPVLK